MASELSRHRWHLPLVGSNRCCWLGHTCPPPCHIGLGRTCPPPPQVGLARTCPPRVGLARTRPPPPPRLGWRAKWTAVIVVEVVWSLCLLDIVVVVAAMLATPCCRRGGGGVVAAPRCHHQLVVGIDDER